LITIDNHNFVGKGSHREVYRHPENQNLCIKIIVDGSSHSRPNRREISYHRHLERRGIAWDMIPKYHGDITTNLGIGSVFDLVSDHDGAVSKTLGYYLSSNDVTEAHYDGLSRSLFLLKDYLLRYRIITKTLEHRNIVCQRNKSGIFRLSVIDSVVNLDFIPICNYIRFLAEKKIHRRWKRFERNLLGLFPHNKALDRMLTSSHR